MQRWLGLVLAVGVVTAACGGKVAVDVGGAGGGSSTGTSTQTSSGCGLVACKTGDNICACTATCSDQALEVDCVDGTCTCVENGIKIFNCMQTAGACDPVGGCCAAAFFGGE